MDNKIANKLGKQLLEIVKDSAKEIDRLKKIENITYNDLDKAHEKAKKTNETMNDLYLKYPELGERLDIDFDSYFSKSPSEVIRERGWASLYNDIENAKKIEKENEYKKMFEITKRAHIEAINETKVNQSKVLKLVDQGENINGSKTERLKVKQIALIHIYEGIQITKDNGSEIAAKYNWTAKNSGLGLYQDYTLYLTKDNRRAEPDNLNKKTLRNKIQLFKSVLPLLTSERAIKMANEDIQYLKNKYEKAYPEN